MSENLGWVSISHCTAPRLPSPGSAGCRGCRGRASAAPPGPPEVFLGVRVAGDWLQLRSPHQSRTAGLLSVCVPRMRSGGAKTRYWAPGAARWRALTPCSPTSCGPPPGGGETCRRTSRTSGSGRQRNGARSSSLPAAALLANSFVHLADSLAAAAPLGDSWL